MKSKFSIQLSKLDGVHEFNGRLAGINHLGYAGLDVSTLDIDPLSSSFGVSLCLIVGTHASLKSFSAGGHADVLDADVYALGHYAVAYAFVADDTEGVLGYVEDSAGLTVVELSGHTSMDSTISKDIDVVSLSVGNEVFAERRNTVLSESLREQTSRASSKTVAVGHLSFKPSKYLI